MCFGCHQSVEDEEGGGGGPTRPSSARDGMPKNSSQLPLLEHPASDDEVTTPTQPISKPSNAHHKTTGKGSGGRGSAGESSHLLKTTVGSPTDGKPLSRRKSEDKNKRKPEKPNRKSM